MKTETKALVASVVVIALALSAVSGITYSWFSDTEQSDIDSTTAVVDYDVNFSGTVNGVAKLKQDGTDNSKFTLSGLAASAKVQMNARITNNSTIQTVYKVVLVPTYAAPEGGAGLTPYDLKNIRVQTSAGTTTDLLAGEGETWKVNETSGVLTSATFSSILIKDWTLVDAPTDSTKTFTVTAVITTPDDYGGGDPKNPVVKIDANGNGYTSSDSPSGTTYDWNAQTERSGLSFELKIVAVQGDYPYEKMTRTTIESKAAVEAAIPTNKVVYADEIESVADGAGDNDAVKNVVMDFSNIGTLSGKIGAAEEATEIDVTKTKVTAQVTDLSSSAVTIDLSLLSISTDGTTQTISSPSFTNPVVITMTLPGELTEPKITYNGENDGKILSSTASGGSTTVVFSVDHFSEYVITDTVVKTAEALQASLNAGGYVKLGANIEVSSDSTTVGAIVSKVAGTVLDLDGYTISTTSWGLIDVQNSLTIRDGKLMCTCANNNDQGPGRVLNINGNNGNNSAAKNMTLTLKDVNVIGPTVDSYNRAISAYGTTNLTINIDGGTISANHYALNIAGKNIGTKCVVKNATITGYSAVQTWSEKAEFQFTNCTLNGVNQWGPGSNNYATIVVCKDNSDSGAESKITCTDCTITAAEQDEGVENLCSLRADCSIVLNGCDFKHKSQTDTYFVDVTQADIQKGEHVQISTGVNAIVEFNSEQTDE